MTDPFAPDNSLEDLVTSLGDNDVGGITETTVRSIVSYARQGSVERSTASVSLPAAVEWQALPEPNAGIRYTLLNRLAESYLKESGPLTAPAANTGITYEVLSGTSDNIQPRQVTVNWSIGISAEYDSLWGVSWWRVPAGSTWPTTTSAWPGGAGDTHDPISPLGLSLFGSAQTSVPPIKYVAPQSGSVTVTLFPGDVLVPALEFYGTLNSTSAVPEGNLDSFVVKATMSSPVEGLTFPEEGLYESVTAEMDTAQAAINYRDVFSGANITTNSDEVRKSILIRKNRPTGSVDTGTTVFNTEAILDGAPAKRLGIYGGAGWEEFESIQSPVTFTPQVMQNALATTRTSAITLESNPITASYHKVGKLVNVWITCTIDTATVAGDYAIRVNLPVKPAAAIIETSTIGNATVWDNSGTQRYHAVCELNTVDVGLVTYYDCVFAVTGASGAGVGELPALRLAANDGIRMQLTYFTD